MLEKLIHRRPQVLAVTAFAVAGFFGCAKPPTLIVTEVNADPTVPELLKLQYSVTRASDPAHPASDGLVSLGVGDAGDGRAPFVFPLLFTVGPLSGWSGPVELTVNGRDFFTDAVIATGKTTAQAIPEQTSHATVTLTGVSRPDDPDAGTGSDATSDADDDAGDDTNPTTDAATGS